MIEDYYKVDDYDILVGAMESQLHCNCIMIIIVQIIGFLISDVQL